MQPQLCLAHLLEDEDVEVRRQLERRAEALDEGQEVLDELLGAPGRNIGAT